MTKSPDTPESQRQPTPSAVASGSPSGPRVRCQASSRSQFFGTYKGHDVEVWCFNKRRIWSYNVKCPDGTDAADGVMRHPGTKREAIVHALTGAMLWPNKVDMTNPHP